MYEAASIQMWLKRKIVSDNTIQGWNMGRTWMCEQEEKVLQTPQRIYLSGQT